MTGQLYAMNSASHILLDAAVSQEATADRCRVTTSRVLAIKQALVAASGDIACGDPPPGKDAWAVDIAPIAKGQEARRLNLANAAVSTSGDLEQFVVIGGVRYSHIVDPKTGLGVTGRRSVTVVALAGITADSMTKAVMLLPPDRALRLVEATPGAAAYVVIVGKDEKLETTASARFGSFLAK